LKTNFACFGIAVLDIVGVACVVVVVVVVDFIVVVVAVLMMVVMRSAVMRPM
jgi:hypothetical protein